MKDVARGGGRSGGNEMATQSSLCFYPLINIYVSPEGRGGEVASYKYFFFPLSQFHTQSELTHLQ
jgi:hypothetical protein